ncbi:unnamed protein product [Laminaria digitata]
MPPPFPPLYTCRPARTPQLFIDSYNKRKPDNKLDSAECHLEVGSGRALAQGDTIGEAITDRADVHVRSGATEEGGGVAGSAAAAAEASSAVDAAEVAKKAGSLRCRNFGCNQFFDEENNRFGRVWYF